MDLDLREPHERASGWTGSKVRGESLSWMLQPRVTVGASELC